MVSHLPNHAYALSQRILCGFCFLFQKTAQNVKIYAERSLADICFLYISYGICIVRDTMVVQLLHFWPVIEEKCKRSEEWNFSFGSLDTTKVAVALFFAEFCMTNCFTFIFFFILNFVWSIELPSFFLSLIKFGQLFYFHLLSSSAEAIRALLPRSEVVGHVE